MVRNFRPPQLFSRRGYVRLFTDSRHRSLPNLLLESLPPIFHVLLLSLLTYFSFHLNPDSSLWRLATLFVVAQILANWGFFLANKSIVIASPKNFPGYMHRFPSLTSSVDFRELHQESERVNSEWKECESCDMHVPLRTYHCGHCKRCIYVLDHHCYFLGHCVGRTNMRYFMVFCFYASIGCALGIYNLINVMLFYRDPWSREGPYYLLPYTALMYFLGRANAFEVLYVALVNFGFGASGACAYLFITGVRSVLTGTTPHEEKKKTKLVKREGEVDDEDVPYLERFRDVFGECGMLHFLIPLVPFEMPKAEIGYRRIVTYNNDYVQDGTIRSSEAALDYTP